MAGRRKVIDPSKITDLESWLKYSDYGNVQKTTDNRLLVLDPTKPDDIEGAKSIPHTYGYDFRALLQSNDERARAPGVAKYEELLKSHKTATSAAQAEYLVLQKAYLAAVEDLKSTVDERERKIKAAAVVKLATDIASADEKVRTSLYPGRFVKKIGSEHVTLRYLNYASMDDRKIKADLNILMNYTETLEERIIEADKA
jgi:hypothetical protein